MESKGRDAPLAIAAAGAAAQPPSVPENIAEGPRRRGGGTKRKTAPSALPAAAFLSSFTPSKRQAKERNPFHHPPPAHNGPCTRARQFPSKLAAAAVSQNPPEPFAAQATAAGGSAKGSSSARAPICLDDELPAEEPLVDAEFEAVRSRGPNVHVVPSFAGWFSWRTIHPIEKQTLASFFSGKSEKRTPEIYMEIRNSIMKKFHADPQVQLELSDFAELSGGDTDANQEVMDFLDHWGLINFHPFPPSEDDASKCDSNSGDKSSSLLEQLYQFETQEPYMVSPPKKTEPSVPAPTTSLLPQPVIVEDLIASMEPSVEYHCNSCSADCSRKRYHCQKQADFDLCTECYNEGKFGTGMSPADFILMESAGIPGAGGASWTDQETLLLLEALELFGENWNEIAEHVATKTKAQCMLHFLQMPIEDSFYEDEDDADKAIQKAEPALEDKQLAAATVPEKTEVEKGAEQNESATIKTSDKIEGDNNVGKLEMDVVSALETEDDKNSGDGDPVALSNKRPEGNGHSPDANIAMDVLKSAFRAVGYFPEQENSGSFAEAGNPVMALAAFLAGLVEHDIAITSCSSSLKAMLEASPSLQLASRHCFILEDPPDDAKDLTASVRPVPNMDAESLRKEDKTPNCTSTEKLNGCDEGNSMPVEREAGISASSIYSGNKPNLKEPVDEGPSSGAVTVKDSGIQISLEERSTFNNPKNVDNPSINAKEMVPLVSEVVEQSTEMEKNGSMLLDKDKLSYAKALDDSTSQGNVQLDILKTEDTVAHSSGGEEHESKQNRDSASRNEEKADMSQKKEALTNDDKDLADMSQKKEALTNDDKDSKSTEYHATQKINRLKRAAATALAAAAVKAKVLAKQEEDEVRKLVSFIIEKQFHKIEAKLALFTDLENMIMRVKEQIERTKQRLHHERSQIIAARLGLPTPSFRPNPSSIPASRFPAGYGMVGLKTPNMASERPPAMRRP